MRTRESVVAIIVVAVVHLVPPAETAATVPKRLPKDVQAVEAMYEQAKRLWGPVTLSWCKRRLVRLLGCVHPRA